MVRAAKDRGLSIPHDLAVIGFDDLDISDYMGLTTVHQPLFESGQIAVRLLLARLRDPTSPVEHLTLPLQVVERSTT